MKSHGIALIAVLLLTACEEEGVPPGAAAADLEAMRTRLVAAEQKLAELQTGLTTLSTAQETTSAALASRLDLEEDATTAVLARLVEVEGSAVAVQDALAPLPAALDDLDTRVAAAAQKLQFVTVKTLGGKPAIVFQGVNVHVLNGLGTEEADGTGNLILGTNDDYGDAPVRTGSHNLVMGIGNSYSAVGSLLVGNFHSASGHRSVLFGLKNVVTVEGGAILGGRENRVTGHYGSIAGGHLNTVQASDGAILGGQGNEVFSLALFSTISGGKDNGVRSPHGSVAGGLGNVVYGTYGAIVGGSGNIVYGTRSAVLGGTGNNVSGRYSVIAGGQGNLIEDTALYGAIGGGHQNRVKNDSWFGTVGGGASNAATGTSMFLP